MTDPDRQQLNRTVATLMGDGEACEGWYSVNNTWIIRSVGHAHDLNIKCFPHDAPPDYTAWTLAGKIIDRLARSGKLTMGRSIGKKTLTFCRFDCGSKYVTWGEPGPPSTALPVAACRALILAHERGWLA